MTISLTRICLGGLLAASLAGCGDKPEAAVETFLEPHWAEPMPPQGNPPAAFTALGDTKRLPKAQQQTLQAAAAAGRAYFSQDGSVRPAATVQKVNAENAISLAQ